MEKGLAEQVDERLLPVNPAEVQQDYIIMTANRRSPGQPHLQMENASLRKPWIQLCWKTYADPPSLLNVAMGEPAVIFLHLYLCYTRARSNLKFHTSGPKRATEASLPSNKSTGSGREHLLYADDVENVSFMSFGAVGYFLLCNSCSPCIFNVLSETIF